MYVLFQGKVRLRQFMSRALRIIQQAKGPSAAAIIVQMKKKNCLKFVYSCKLYFI